MKRNDWILSISAIIYSLLFYRQSAGINFLMFNIILILFLLVIDKERVKKKDWLIAMLGCVLSSASVVLYGNVLSVTANIISLGLLSAFSFNADTSVMVSLLNSAYSFFSAPVFAVIDYVERQEVKENSKAGTKRNRLMVLIPVLITTIFFFLYRSSSTLFDALAAKINLDFISWNWIWFTVGGALLLYGFYSHKSIEGLNGLDSGASNNLSGTAVKPLVLFGKTWSMADENYSATLLFALLNILLLIVNALDIDFMFGGDKLPLGVSYKQFVHQGTDTLITSIIIAIALILFYFRGGLNFYEKNKVVKVLAVAWIVQNAFMVCSTAWRNYSYIDEFGLTYKRIGVYVYLLLALIGLVTTLVKIINAKTNMYLFRKNGWVWYVLLVLLSFPDWARIVSNYNTTHVKNVDAGYLMSISSSTIPDLLPYYENLNFDVTDSAYYANRLLADDYCESIYDILSRHDSTDIRSWCYGDAQTYNEITSERFESKLTKLWLHDENKFEPMLKQFSIYKHIEELRLTGIRFASVKELAQFSNVKKLDISDDGGKDIYQLNLSGIEAFSNLESLDLSHDVVTDYSPLYSLRTLKGIQVSNISDSTYNDLRHRLPNVNIDRVPNH